MLAETKPDHLSGGNFWRLICIVGMVASCIVLTGLNLLFIGLIFFNKNRKADDLPGLLVVQGFFALFLMVAVVITIGLIRNRPSERGGFLIPLVIIRGAGICFIVGSVLLALKGDFGLIKMVKGSLAGLAMLFAGMSWEKFVLGKGKKKSAEIVSVQMSDGVEAGIANLVSRPEDLAELIANSPGKVLVVYTPQGAQSGKNALDEVLHVQEDLQVLGLEIAFLAPNHTDLANEFAEAGYPMDGLGGEAAVLALWDRNGLIGQWVGEDGLASLLQWLVAENSGLAAGERDNK